MKTAVAACFLLAALVATPASAGILFYGGDLNPADPNANGLANEKNLAVDQAAIYTPFLVDNGGWNVTGLFTDNFMSSDAPSALWEIRSGVSAGNGGTLLFSGSAAPTVTDTGLNDFSYEIFKVEVTGLNIYLSPGQYWLSVVPVCLDANDAKCTGGSFNANTDGTNAIGTAEPQDQSFFNSNFFSANFANANGQGVFHAFSSGVEGTVVPEPATLTLLGAGLLILGRLQRRKR